MKRFSIFLQSVRFRLTLWYVGILALVMLILGAIVYLALSGSLHSGLDDLLRARGSQVAASYNIADGQLNLQEQDENGPVLPAEGEVLLLVDPQGQIVQKAGHLSTVDTASLVKMATGISGPGQEYFGNFKVAPFATSASDLGHQLDYRFYVTPVVDNNQVVATLVIGRSLESTEIIARNLLLVLIIAAPLALLTSALGGYWLATRAMRPIRTITQAARQMSESDLSKRFNFKRKDELGELAFTFDQLFARLENAFNRQRQFTADASHELRTPLAIINLEAEQTLAGASSLQEYRRALKIINSEGSNMARLVGDMLTLARTDVGHNQNSIKQEGLDLSEIALEVVERLSSLAQQQGVQLSIGGSYLPELPVQGNYLYLNRMLTNLVENAIKYTATATALESSSNSSSDTQQFDTLPRQSRPLIARNSNPLSGKGGADSQTELTQNWVKVETGREGNDWVWVRVSDNGPGISANHLPFLFDRFYRVDSSRTPSSVSEGSENSLNENEEISDKPGGSGLGLAIVKWVAEVHGGIVTVKSNLEPGKNGSCFEVRLPASKQL